MQETNQIAPDVTNLAGLRTLASHNWGGHVASNLPQPLPTLADFPDV